MRKDLAWQVQKFMKSAGVSKTDPLLLGYSGGPDSKALLYLLKAGGWSPILVHVDHGWREESRREAEAISGEASCLGLKSYQRRLQKYEGGNLEGKAREARYQFFEEIYEQEGAKALLLAHQGNDLAETVLKRLFEGAHPSHWQGIRADSQISGMRVLRPLLKVAKEDLTSWLSSQGLQGFIDPTNCDPRFLRARMREELIPLLSHHFGKNVMGGLLHASEVAAEIDSYFIKRCQSYLEKMPSLEENLDWDLSGLTERMEVNWLLKQWIDKGSVRVSREELREMVAAICDRHVNRRFLIKHGLIKISNGVFNYKNN